MKLNSRELQEISENLSAEQLDYLRKVQLASDRVAQVLKSNPELDSADLFRIVLKSEETYDQKLASGLRRRVLRHV